jgi:TonB family protein
VGAFLQKRRAAAIVGIGVITLPLAAWGVAGAARSSQAKWVENRPVTASAPNIEQQAAAVASPAEIAKLTADSVNRANAARSEKSSTTKSEVKEEPTNITMPAAPSVVVRVDSVRGIGTTPFTAGGESVLRHLSASSAASPGNVAAGTGAVRARMIGALPTPRYPGQQLMGRTGGEVRVRFDVDTLGRPVMSTFTVVASPVAALAKAVKDVVPGIRFEPARTPWPENRPIVETVELAFQFGVVRGR